MEYLLRESGFDADAVNYPLLTDPSLTVSATYGVAFQMRIHVEVSNRPATFIIDKAGILAYARRGATFNDCPTAEETLEELQRLNSRSPG